MTESSWPRDRLHGVTFYPTPLTPPTPENIRQLYTIWHVLKNKHPRRRLYEPFPEENDFSRESALSPQSLSPPAVATSPCLLDDIKASPNKLLWRNKQNLGETKDGNLIFRLSSSHLIFRRGYLPVGPLFLCGRRKPTDEEEGKKGKYIFRF